jgi:hypothetical protein
MSFQMADKPDARTLHQLRLMATKLQNDPTTMAWIIGTYQKQEHLSWDKISSVLKTTEDVVVKLALCKRPNTDSSDFGRQVTQLAQYTNTDLVLLVNMIRHVESVAVLSSRASTSDMAGQKSVQLGFSAARDKSVSSSTDENADKTGEEGDVADE